jgi:DNA adenine methylase
MGARALDHRPYAASPRLCSVLLRKPRSKVEVYNDLDEEIVGIFRVLQDPTQCRELFRRLRRTPYARREFEQAFKMTDDPLIRTQRAIVRSYMSFHHESLFNRRKTTFSDARHRGGNHSKAHEWMTYPRHLASICRRLRGVIIECRPAHDVIRAQDTHDALFFVDPPYVTATRSHSGRYRHEMTKDQHVALLTLLRNIQGMAMISGYASDLYDDLLHDWQRVERPHYAAASGSQPRTDVLWISPRR